MRPPTPLETPCLEWTGARHVDGYGIVWRDGRARRLHRWIWVVANGPIPDGMCVLHRCDNPPCFRLDHLYLGTHAENVADMNAKGRNGNSSRTHCIHGHPLSGDNLKIERDGHRRCMECNRISCRAYWHRKSTRPTGEA